MSHDLRSLADTRYDDVRKRTYVALDYPTWADAKVVVETMGSAVDGYKVGLQLFHGDGALALRHLSQLGKRIFLDVKLHDIPNTVAGALRAICEHDIEMVNIHASGGRKMMEAARQAVDEAPNRPLLIGVTALTSLADADLLELGLPSSGAWVNRLAQLAMHCGLDGVVASALDIPQIRAWCHPAFEIVVPGTRPVGANQNDQARTATPAAAFQSGASRLVLGRVVTKAVNPLQTLLSIWEEMLPHVQANEGGGQDGSSVSR